MGKLLEGKVAIVTGSGQGVGRALAMKYAAEGAMVVTNNRKPGQSETKQLTPEEIATLSPEDLKKVRERYAMLAGDAATTANAIVANGGKAAPFFADIGNFDAAKDLVEFAVKTYGKIDIIANVAGAIDITTMDDAANEAFTNELQSAAGALIGYLSSIEPQAAA